MHGVEERHDCGNARPSIALSAAISELFRRQGYVVVPHLIEPALADFFWSYVHTKFASLLLSAGDGQVPNTPGDYGDPAFDGLLEYLRPRIEDKLRPRALPDLFLFPALQARRCSQTPPRPAGLRNQRLFEYRADAGRSLADLRRARCRTLWRAAYAGRCPALSRLRLLALARRLIKAAAWFRYFCITSIATGRTPTRNTMDARR